jgi:aromatic ring-opening dioxygenase catalytic subunit (LigB family)
MNKDLTLLEKRIIAKNTLSAYKWRKIIKMGHKKETYDYFKIPKYYYDLKFYIKNNPIITKILHLI